MTLDEAIRHAENVADYDCYNDEQTKCAEEHNQLAVWLKELKKRREIMSCSKWAYDPRKCDGEPCVGDCDLCSKKDEYFAPVYGCVGCKWKGSACKECARHYPDRFEWKGGQDEQIN